jgi:hypothetical protein
LAKLFVEAASRIAATPTPGDKGAAPPAATLSTNGSRQSAGKVPRRPQPKGGSRKGDVMLRLAVSRSSSPRTSTPIRRLLMFSPATANWA